MAKVKHSIICTSIRTEYLGVKKDGKTSNTHICLAIPSGYLSKTR